MVKPDRSAKDGHQKDNARGHPARAARTDRSAMQGTEWTGALWFTPDRQFATRNEMVKGRLNPITKNVMS